MIRPELYNSITRSLENTNHFKAEEFIIKEVIEKSTKTIHIEYIFTDGCVFRTTVPSEKKEITGEYGSRMDYEFNILMSPGGIASDERERVVGKPNLLAAIIKWTEYIHEDLSATPINRRLNEQQVEPNRLAKDIENLPNEFFSKEEAEHIKEQLEELENRLRNNLQEQAKDRDNLKAKLENLARDFSELKMQLDSLKQPKWAGALLVRVLRWAKEPENQNLLKSGTEVVQNLLTSGKPGSE